ncbi:MAG: penicillin acylase family protein [Desulfurococcales archaeon]|nr:penicillin acylase family protein [Desulfurococcales archaeon]
MPRRLVAILAAILGVLFLVIPYAAPILQAFLDPVHGVTGAALAAGLPSGDYKAEVIGNATVVWDKYGVPHIYASTDEAGVYALGWVSASMRLFQMDLLRRIGEGNLSALVGEPGYDNDVFIHSIGLNHVIKEIWLQIEEKPELAKLKSILIAYSKGVNDYIRYAEENNLLPVEYRVLGQKPAPWRPQDTIAIARVIALVLAWNDEDLVLGKLVDKWGPQIIAYMDMDNWTGTLEQADCRYAVTWGSISLKPNAYDYNHMPMLGKTIRVATSDSRSVPPNPQPILAWIHEIREEWWSRFNPLASNNWVVSAKASSTGKPIVANDPHLQLTAPPIWILAELHTPSFKAIGALFPGTPLIVIGRNQHLAWGFTNSMGDYTDYYYFKWKGDEYYYMGHWLKANVSTEEIKVWDPIHRKYTVRTLKVLRTVDGPVLEKNGVRYAVRWTGLDPSFELQFFVELNNASNVREAITAQRWFHVPIQNFVVADDQGNIAYSPVGAYPVRENLPVLVEKVNVAGRVKGPIVNKGYIPFNGSRGEGVWVRYIPKEKLPILYDPPIPFIATANTKPWKGKCGGFVGWHYADKYRLERITELLDEALKDGKITPGEVKKVQTDYYDLSIEDYLETAILPYSNTTYAQLLKDWLSKYGPDMDKTMYQPTIAVAWIYEFHTILWKHLYGNETNLYFFRFHYALSIVRAAEKGDQYALKLIPGGSIRALVNESLTKALEVLKAYYGTSNYEQWIYGKIHYYYPAHPAFPALSYAKIPANGGPYSINVARPAKVDPKIGMPVQAGPSIRQVVDLSAMDYYISLPGGESGNPFSNHYQDIYVDYWSRNLYINYTLGQPPSSYNGPKLVFHGGR